MEDVIERQLCELDECFVYNIPPRKSALGHKAADWNIAAFLWTGRCRIVEREDVAYIRLLEAKSDKLFAECKVNEHSVEAAIDSSRFFVLTIEDPASGRRAFIGLGFSLKPTAYDFKATLDDHRKYLVNKEEARKTFENLGDLNLQIPEGEKIHINFKGIKTSKKKAIKKNDEPQPLLKPGMIAPPPSSTNSPPKISPPPSIPHVTSARSGGPPATSNPAAKTLINPFENFDTTVNSADVDAADWTSFQSASDDKDSKGNEGEWMPF
mmetsp:Transcript_24978/g.27795  ORF Transcript_24978/g.27795 Transcript_24978/m.27795 type:complete len:267 (-) Transcript_24978:31-831(-)